MLLQTAPIHREFFIFGTWLSATGGMVAGCRLKVKLVRNTLIVVVGPTGVGKSAVSMEIAGHFRTEIISSDSRQIYRELAVGTAVPPPEDLRQVKHHFIQTHSIHDSYNASRFESEVLSTLDELFPRLNPVVMTGGSMLYVDTVCKGIDDLPTVDPLLREDLLERFRAEGLEPLRLQLRQLDPEFYAVVDLKNPKRILHALEMCLMTGKPYSSLRTNTPRQRPFRIIKVGLNMPREELYDRINRRVDQMVASGLVEEARSVYAFRELNSLNTVGYKELFQFFDGQLSMEEAVERIRCNSRKYARKQLTWFRKDPDITWFEPHERNAIIQFLEEQLAL